MFFFTFIKTLKTCIETLNCSIHSSKKHRQYESNKVNNTATKHSNVLNVIMSPWLCYRSKTGL